MYAVFFFNLGYTKHFDTLDKAVKCAKESGFQCSIINPDGLELIRKESM